MIVIVGLVVLLFAVIAGLLGVLNNAGPAHPLSENFSVLGYHVTGSTGTLFLFGIVIGALAIEPLHPAYAADRACVNTTKQALDICDRLDAGCTGALGVALDVYHIWWDPDVLPQITRAGKDRLLAFHVCDWLVPTKDILNDRGMMGDGVIDIKSLRAAVEAQGYSGYSEIEIFSNDWWERPVDEVLRTCIERHRSVV